MSGHTERLCRTLHLLESVAGLQTDASSSGIAAQANNVFVTNMPKIVRLEEANVTRTTFPSRRKGGTSFERERQACLEMRELLIGWNGKGQQKQVEKRELSRRAIGALFLVLDHREQSLRFAADQALDAIFRVYIANHFSANEKFAAFCASFGGFQSDCLCADRAEQRKRFGTGTLCRSSQVGLGCGPCQGTKDRVFLIFG